MIQCDQVRGKFKIKYHGMKYEDNYKLQGLK